MEKMIVTDKKEWHEKQFVSVSHMLATMAMAITLFSWASDIDKRVAENKLGIEHYKEMSQLDSENKVEVIARVERKVDKLDRKIDALMDKINGTHSNGQKYYSDPYK